MRSAECGVRSAECGVRSAECGKCGVWKMRSVENVENFYKSKTKEISKCRLTYSTYVV